MLLVSALRTARLVGFWEKIGRRRGRRCYRRRGAEEGRVSESFIACCTVESHNRNEFNIFADFSSRCTLHCSFLREHIPMV
jgi:hypothetical protein